MYVCQSEKGKAHALYALARFNPLTRFPDTNKQDLQHQSSHLAVVNGECYGQNVLGVAGKAPGCLACAEIPKAKGAVP